MNVLDLSAYKELKRAKERVKEQQPVDKSAAEGNGVKPPTSRPSFIPDTSKGGWMTSFADMDSRNSLASAATDSSKTGPPVPHHHHHSSKDAKDKKRSDEERRSEC